MRQTKDLSVVFWNDWLKADEDKRVKLVSQTMIARDLAEHMMHKLGRTKIKKSYYKNFTARTINEYFQDLEQAMMSKNHNI